MRHWLFALIMLTQLDGSPVWVEANQLIVIRQRGSECGPGVGGVIIVGTRVLCVKEKPDDIRVKINKNGGVK